MTVNTSYYCSNILALSAPASGSGRVWALCNPGLIYSARAPYLTASIISKPNPMAQTQRCAWALQAAPALQSYMSSATCRSEKQAARAAKVAQRAAEAGITVPLSFLDGADVDAVCARAPLPCRTAPWPDQAWITSAPAWKMGALRSAACTTVLHNPLPGSPWNCPI